MSAVPPAEDAESRQPLMAEGGETGAAQDATQFVVQGVPLAAEQQQHSFKNGANPAAADVEQVVGSDVKERSSAPAPDEQVVPAVAPRSLCGVWVRLGWKRLLYLVFAVVATFLLVYAKINARNGLTGPSGDWFYALTFLLLAFLCPAAPKVESGAGAKGGRAECCTSQSLAKDGRPAAGAGAKAIELQAAKTPALTAGITPAQMKAAQTKTSPSAKPRLLFLDNLKVFLTFAVVFFHVSVGFGGWKWQAYTLTLGNHEDNHLGKALSTINLINQSYFMSLFFFISGFFVPSSLQRKGAAAFLEDKFMRLGLPLVLGGFLFFPLTTAASMQAAFGTDYGAVNPDGASPLHLVQNLMQAPELWYVVGLGPLWFLQALLVFNLVFCVLYPKGLDSMGRGGLPLPGLAEMLLVGSLFGLLQGWTLQDGFGWQNSGRFQFLDVPNLYGGGGGLFFDILFFFAGAFAKKNNWLEQIVEMSARPIKKSTREDDEQDEVADIEEGRVEKQKAAVSEMPPASSRSRWSIWGCRLHAAVIVGCIIALTVTIDPKLAPPQHSRCGHFQQAVAKQFAKEPEIYNRLFPDLPIEKAAAKEWALNYPPAAPRDTTPQEERPWSRREGWLQDQLLKGNSLFWHVLRGQLSISLSFVLLQFFAQFANGEAPEQKGWNQFKKALGEGAYGVYLFHWMVWPLFLWLFLSRMYPSLRGEEATLIEEENLEFLFCADRMFAAKGPMSQPLMGALFALTFLSTNLLLWPLCFYLRKIPGLDKVL